MIHKTNKYQSVPWCTVTNFFKLTSRGAVVVSMLVTTYLLVKSSTDVKRKNEATPMEATTIKIHIYTPRCWCVSIRWCHPCKLVERQKSLNADFVFSTLVRFPLHSFAIVTTRLLVCFGLSIFSILFRLSCSWKQSWLVLLQLVKK